MQSQESEDEDEHAEVYKQTDKEQRIGVPLENIVHILIDYEAVHQREETAQRRDVDDPLDDGDFGGGRQLLLDWRNQGDVAENHCSDRSKTVWQIVVLEEDGQTEQWKKQNRDEDGGQRVSGVFVKGNNEMSVLEVFDLNFILLLFSFGLHLHKHFFRHLVHFF